MGGSITGTVLQMSVDRSVEQLLDSQPRHIEYHDLIRLLPKHRKSSRSARPAWVEDRVRQMLEAEKR